MHVALHIPVKPYVKKYLVAQYGADQIPLKKTDDIRLFLHNMIGKPGNRYKAKRLSGCLVTFLLSQDTFDRLGSSITEEHILDFNQFVEEKIRHELYIDVLFATACFDINKNDAIADFMEVYGFDDNDIKHETLRKAFYRFELGKSKRILGKIVPNGTKVSQAPAKAKTAEAIRKAAYRARLKLKKRKVQRVAMRYAESDL